MIVETDFVDCTDNGLTVASQDNIGCNLGNPRAPLKRKIGVT